MIVSTQYNGGNGGHPFVKVSFDSLPEAEAFFSDVERLAEVERVLRAIYAEGMTNHATRCAPWWIDVLRALGKLEP